MSDAAETVPPRPEEWEADVFMEPHMCRKKGMPTMHGPGHSLHVPLRTEGSLGSSDNIHDLTICEVAVTVHERSIPTMVSLFFSIEKMREIGEACLAQADERERLAAQYAERMLNKTFRKDNPDA